MLIFDHELFDYLLLFETMSRALAEESKLDVFVLRFASSNSAYCWKKALDITFRKEAKCLGSESNSSKPWERCWVKKVIYSTVWEYYHPFRHVSLLKPGAGISILCILGHLSQNRRCSHLENGPPFFSQWQLDKWVEVKLVKEGMLSTVPGWKGRQARFDENERLSQIMQSFIT